MGFELTPLTAPGERLVALAAQGQGAEGIAQIRQGLAAYQATGAALGMPGFLARLAVAYGQVGQVDEGLHLVVEALAIARRQQAKSWELRAATSLTRL
jgi:hypothetical protein